MDILFKNAKYFEEKLNKKAFKLIAKTTKNNKIELFIYIDETRFKHLLGLHHLKDVAIIQRNSSRQILHDILKKDITYYDIKDSDFINLIQGRLNYFSEIRNIIFNSDLMKKSLNDRFFIGIKADYVLVKRQKQKKQNLYLQLFLKNDGITVPITFFDRYNDLYLKDKIKLKVLSVEELENIKSLIIPANSYVKCDSQTIKFKTPSNSIFIAQNNMVKKQEGKYIIYYQEGQKFVLNPKMQNEKIITDIELARIYKTTPCNVATTNVSKYLEKNITAKENQLIDNTEECE